MLVPSNDPAMQLAAPNDLSRFLPSKPEERSYGECPYYKYVPGQTQQITEMYDERCETSPSQWGYKQSAIVLLCSNGTFFLQLQGLIKTVWN